MSQGSSQGEDKDKRKREEEKITNPVSQGEYPAMSEEKFESKLEQSALAHEQLLDTLTLEIIGKMERGERPDFGAYAIKYPQLADELKANLANYWLEDRETIRELEEERTSPEAIQRLAKRLADSNEQRRLDAALASIFTGTAANVNKTVPGASNPQATSQVELPVIPGLYKLATTKGIKPLDLARKIDLSPDLMMKLDRRAFRLTSLPQELLTRLSQVLEVSAAQLKQYLSGTQPLAGSAYHLNQDKPQNNQQQDFVQSVRESEGLTTAQKIFWLKEIETNLISESDQD